MKIETLSDKIFEGIKASVDESPREHLGASQVGKSCDRAIWYGFRWIAREDFSGRMLRLFRRGHLEEEHLINDLRNAGMVIEQINPITKKQLAFDDGFFKGSCDGIILSGVPEAPNKKHILEIKTASAKSFASMVKEGVAKSKPEHFAQMQVYMGKFDIDRALYVMVNKDTDDIYTERVRFDKSIYEALCARAHRIIKSDRIPEPVSVDPSWYECKFCSAHANCHKNKVTTEVTCRTCANITFCDDGKAYCEHWESEVPYHAQLEGCDNHILHLDLVPFEMRIDDGKVFWKINNEWIQNGEADKLVFTSKEIVADPEACASMMNDTFAQEVRVEMGARICS